MPITAADTPPAASSATAARARSGSAPTAGRPGLGVGEQQHVDLAVPVGVDGRRHPVAVALAAAGQDPGLGQRPDAGQDRHRRDVQHGVHLRRGGHLHQVPEQPEPRHVRAARRPRGDGGPRRRRVARGHRRHGRRDEVVLRGADLDRCRGDPDAERLGEHQRVAVAQAGVAQDPVRVRLADHREPVLGLRIVHAVPADHDEPTLRRDLGAAREHLGEQGRRQVGRRPGHQVQREQRAAAHRVHVRRGVLRRDPPPRARVVDERGEEVRRRHEGAVGVQPPHGGVVARLRADEQLRSGRRGEGAQDLRQQAGGELARAPGPVAELGETAGHGPEPTDPSGAPVRRRRRTLVP